MEIKTEFLDAYPNKIDKLLNHCNNQKYMQHDCVPQFHAFLAGVDYFVKLINLNIEII